MRARTDVGVDRAVLRDEQLQAAHAREGGEEAVDARHERGERRVALERERRERVGRGAPLELVQQVARALGVAALDGEAVHARPGLCGGDVQVLDGPWGACEYAVAHDVDMVNRLEGRDDVAQGCGREVWVEEVERRNRWARPGVCYRRIAQYEAHILEKYITET